MFGSKKRELVEELKDLYHNEKSLGVIEKISNLMTSSELNGTEGLYVISKLSMTCMASVIEMRGEKKAKEFFDQVFIMAAETVSEFKEKERK